MEVTNRQKYTLLAFFLTLGFVMVYLKTMVIEPPANGKPEKKWTDILLTSLPIAVLVAITVYFVACETADSPDSGMPEGSIGFDTAMQGMMAPRAPPPMRPMRPNNAKYVRNTRGYGQ